jgi:hypothetical protein
MGRIKHIVIADDEAECRQEFASRPEQFKVLEVDNANNLIDELKKLFSKGHRPDLVLLDIWRPADRVPRDQSDRESRAKKSLQDLTAQLELTRGIVQEAWIPRGFHILKEIRKVWPNPTELPVALYSKRGYFLATPEQLEQVENQNAHWILKHEENEFFEYVQDRIDRLVGIYDTNRNTKKKIMRMRFISILAIFISIAILALFIGGHVLGANSLPETVVSCILSVVLTYGLDRLLLR